MSDDENPEGLGGPIRRILEAGSVAGAPAYAIAQATGDPHAATVALVTAGLGAAAQLRKEVFPTTSERLDPAQERADREAARRVVPLERRVDEMGVRVEDVERLALELGRDLREQWGQRAARRTAAVGRELLRLVREGHARFDEFDNDDGRATEAVMEAIRFSVDALSDDAVPMIARLSGRPIDHFYRGVCRVLVDLDQAELGQLRDLVGNVATKIREHGAFHRPQLDLLSRPPRLVWALAENEGERVPLHIRSDSDVLRLLVAHRLAEAPFEEQVAALRQQASLAAFGTPSGGGIGSDRVLSMRTETILALHFVLSGERVVDPRATAS